MSTPFVDFGRAHFVKAPAEKDVDHCCEETQDEAPPSDKRTQDRSTLPAAFTPRDEEREWASITPAEMLEIESDLRGLSFDSVSGSGHSNYLIAGMTGKESGPHPVMTEEEREIALLPALEVEIAAIPDSEKEAYLEATRKSPDLVDDEHKKAFLFKEGFDTKVGEIYPLCMMKQIPWA
mmetsp:Transcript_33541/g.99947  ORF Transcript_33541/g.99947 Transcript_33541/m.99947 type:complete len:179 (+) Transcript_33541:104-640(+)